MHYFSATWCLLSQHTASLASNSSEMDSEIVQWMFPRCSGHIWYFAFEIDARWDDLLN